MKTLVVYFSAEGHTAQVAKDFAQENGLDLFEIRPVEPYTKADINWKNPLSRCNREKIGRKDVPVSGIIDDFASYGTVFIGFPIWYGCAPNVVNTFCKQYDWAGKSVIAFATSGGSPIGKTASKLSPYVEGALSLEAVLVKDSSDLNGYL